MYRKRLCNQLRIPRGGGAMAAVVAVVVDQG